MPLISKNRCSLAMFAALVGCSWAWSGFVFWNSLHPTATRGNASEKSRVVQHGGSRDSRVRRPVGSTRSDPRQRPPQAPPASVPDQEQRDFAVHCLVRGAASPPIESIDPVTLDAILVVLAWNFAAYRDASFDAYLQLRREDLLAASISRRKDLAALRAILIQDLGVPDVQVPVEWIAALELYWNSLYESPPVARFLPATTRFRLCSQVVRGLSPRWPDLLDERPTDEPFTTVRHRLAVAHRRDLSQVLAADGSIRWFDFAIDFETEAGATARMFLRYVWNATESEWFLQQALTQYPRGYGLRKNRSYLVF